MKSSLTGGLRNSSIELLRLVSMLMIVGFHYIIANPDMQWLVQQQVSFSKFVYQFIYMGGGWIGNFIFFTISVWFLLDRHLSLRDSLRRVWILERELLFWSFVLFGILCIAKYKGAYDGGILGIVLNTIFPLLTGMWWYPTSYALFLIFLPFLVQGLKALGKQNHAHLAICVFILWGVLSLIPYPSITLDLNKRGVFVFLYWFVLLSYYRWYMPKLKDKTCYMLIAAGLGIELVYWSVASAIFTVTGKGTDLQNFIFDYWHLPTMMIGFGLFVLCERHSFHSSVVNKLAASAFGVYLIHYHPGIYRMWTSWVPLRDVYTSVHPILLGAAVIVGVFCICILLDLIRQGLFAITVNRHSGHWFDCLYERITKRYERAHPKHVKAVEE